MAPSVPNPVENSYSTSDPPPISTTTHAIAGILCTLYGLKELPPNVTRVACLWLLHPRLANQSSMAPFAANLIAAWNAHLASSKPSPKSKGDAPLGLIAVSFDQRNHGTRLVSALSNEAWRPAKPSTPPSPSSPKPEGNPNHAPDMYSIYTGTALDTSQLLDFLPSYIFPLSPTKIVSNIVLGVSLGGHAAWHVLLRDPRFTSAVVCIGCPDFKALMSDRARLSKLKDWTGLGGEGRGFLGSASFPESLVEVVNGGDPKGLLIGEGEGWGKSGKGDVGAGVYGVWGEDRRGAMRRGLGGKRVLNLSGREDKLVPYHCGKPFLDWLKKASGKGGWFEDGGLHLEDIIIPDCGHEVPPAMVKEMVRFVIETLDLAGREPEGSTGSGEGVRFSTKIKESRI